VNSLLSALFVALAAVVGASLPTYLTGRQRSAEKRQDWARQDQVAAMAEARAAAAEHRAFEAASAARDVATQAREAARLLEQRQNAQAAEAAETAHALLISNEKVAVQAAQSTAVVTAKLSQIHDLVNSNLTSQMDIAHVASVQQLLLMHEVVRLNRAAGSEPPQSALDAIATLEQRIAEMASVLKDRVAADAAAAQNLSQEV
jgi:hypothetical protein